MKILIFVALLIGLAVGQMCTNTKQVAQKISVTGDQSWVVDGMDIIATFIEVAPCLGITFPPANPSPCGAGCRNITQNLAINTGGCLVVNGTDIVERLRTIQMTCP